MLTCIRLNFSAGCRHGVEADFGFLKSDFAGLGFGIGFVTLKMAGFGFVTFQRLWL